MPLCYRPIRFSAAACSAAARRNSVFCGDMLCSHRLGSDHMGRPAVVEGSTRPSGVRRARRNGGYGLLLVALLHTAAAGRTYDLCADCYVASGGNACKSVHSHVCYDAVTCDIFTGGENDVCVDNLCSGIVSLCPSSCPQGFDNVGECRGKLSSLDRTPTHALMLTTTCLLACYSAAKPYTGPPRSN